MRRELKKPISGIHIFSSSPLILGWGALNNNKMNNIPTTIYLQVGEGPFSEDEDFRDVEMSWCRDKIFDTDIEYCRISDTDTLESINQVARQYSYCFVYFRKDVINPENEIVFESSSVVKTGIVRAENINHNHYYLSIDVEGKTTTIHQHLPEKDFLLFVESLMIPIPKLVRSYFYKRALARV